MDEPGVSGRETADPVPFFHRLRERKLVQWALAYLAGAWVLLQLCGLLSSTFAWPPLAMRAITVLLAFGLFAALILAWYHGEKGQQRASGLELLMLAALLVVAGLAVAFVTQPGDTRAPVETAAAAVSAPAVAATPSLAVLPFENVGGQEANAAFAVGLHDDLLTQLSKIGGLRLVSRTSMREYAGTTKNVRDIARELGVGTLLEGSVQRDAQQVRINVQLIDGATDKHLWAERYDRDLTVANLFEIQADIAQAVAGALRAELAGEARDEIARPPTENLAAYQAYLRGLAAGYWDYEPTAAEAFAEATRLDPSFAEAFAGEARARTWLARLAFQAGDLRYARRMAKLAHDAAARASALAPDAPETRLAEGYVAYYIDWDLGQALARFRQVQAMRPNDAEVANAVGLILRRLGRWEDALVEFRRVMALDERNMVGPYELGQTYLYMGRFDNALRYCRLALELLPGGVDAVEITVQAVAGKGDTASLRRFLEQERPRGSTEVPDPWLLVPLSQGAMERRLVETIDNRERGAVSMAYWAAARWAYRLGKPDLQREYADSLLAVMQPALRSLGEAVDPRVRSDQHRLAALAFAYRGDAADAVRHARRAVELIPFELDAIEGWGARESLLEVLIVTRRFDEAVTAARELIRPPSPYSIERLKTDPLTEPLRSHPGFLQLIGEAER